MARRFAPLTALLALAWAVPAARAAETDVVDYFGDLPVVLSASRLVQTIAEAPAAVTVIDRQMIQASGMRTVVDLFRLVPGMVVGMYKGHQATLGFHGLSDPYFRQLQVLVDGVSIYNPMWGGVEWNELPLALEDIERIEVVRGPNAAAYGANSFLGAVNIITRDPAEERGLELAANVGENRIGDVLVRHAATRGDLRYRVTAGQRTDDGLDSRPDTWRSNFMNLRGHYRLGADELRLQAAYAGGSVGLGVYAVPNHSDGARPRNADTGSVQLRWTRAHGSDDESWVQLAHAEGNYRDVLPYVLAGKWDYPLNFDRQHRRTDLEAQRTRRWDDTLRGVWGAQFRRDGAQSQTYFGSGDWRNNELYRLFGNLEWRPAAGWSATPGVMIERNTISGTSVSPSLAINRQLLPGHAVRLRWANARRTPTLFEAHANWRYQPPEELRALLLAMKSPLATLPLAQSYLTRDTLNDESISSRELSYLGQFPDLRLNVELHLFRYRLGQLIGSSAYPYDAIAGYFPAPGDPSHRFTSGYVNQDAATVNGRSGAIRWEPRTGTRVHLAGSRTAIGATGANATALAASAPGYTVSLLVSQDLPGDWRSSLGYYRVGPMRTLSGGDPLPATDRVDLRLARGFRLGRARGEAALVVKNATGSMPLFELRDIDRRTSWLHIRFEY